jgi:DNA repair exonuclease SbcCD ATPase subunit
VLRLKTVRFQNLRSFGNELTEVRLDKNPRTLVMGKNGAGKSSAILDSLNFGLFGKPYTKITKNQLVNSITGKNLLVEVEFSDGRREYKVRRGYKPSLFEVYRDEVLLPTPGDSRDHQEWLEKSVLRLNQKSFNQVVVLGTANYVPFMRLPAASRREVIEDVLDIQVFSVMNQVMKERAETLKSSMATIEKDLAVALKELEVEERHLEARQRDTRELLEKKDRTRAEIIEKLTMTEARAVELEAEARELTRTISDYEDVEFRLRETIDVRGKITYKLGLVQEEVAFFRDHLECPSCSQSLSEEFRSVKSLELGEKVEKLARAEEALDQKVRGLNDRLEEIRKVADEVARLNRAIVDASGDVRFLRTSLEGIDKEIAELDDLADEVNPLALEEMRARTKELGRGKDDLLRQARVMGAASKLLKDGGVKAAIIRQYVPVMNNMVNKYLAELELFVDFHLDENFNETIRSRHRDTWSYESFSEGEKLRIDLAILFAWRAIARLRNSAAVSLLVFDEVLDSSLDADGCDYLLALLSKLTHDTNVFIVSHRGDQLADKFSDTIRFVKRANFSRIEE